MIGEIKFDIKGGQQGMKLMHFIKDRKSPFYSLGIRRPLTTPPAREQVSLPLCDGTFLIRTMSFSLFRAYENSKKTKLKFILSSNLHEGHSFKPGTEILPPSV